MLCKFEEGHRGPGNLCKACVSNTYFETCVLITNLGGKNTYISELWAGQEFIGCQRTVGSDEQGGQKTANMMEGFIWFEYICFSLSYQELSNAHIYWPIYDRDTSICHFCTFSCLTNAVSSYRARSNFCALSEIAKNT